MRCPNCNTEFEKKVAIQKYCSIKCSTYAYNKSYNLTHDFKKYRKRSECSKCKHIRRVYSDGICESCHNIDRIGKSKKSIVGECIVCKRSNLTLTANKCKSCYKYGFYVGGKTISHGEAMLRKSIAIIFPNTTTEYNFKPQWLKSKDKRQPYEIDVALTELKIGFEFDGRPHVDPKHPGFFKTQSNDKAKCGIIEKSEWLLVKIKNTRIASCPNKLMNILKEIGNILKHNVQNTEKLAKDYAFIIGKGYHKYLQLFQE